VEICAKFKIDLGAGAIAPFLAQYLAASFGDIPEGATRGKLR
jgi:hypothetical protein